MLQESTLDPSLDPENGAADSPSDLLQGHQDVPLEDLIGAGLKVRRVYLVVPVGRRLFRVVIGGEGLPRLALRAAHCRDAVITALAGLEHDAAVEDRRE